MYIFGQQFPPSVVLPLIKGKLAHRDSPP